MICNDVLTGIENLYFVRKREAIMITQEPTKEMIEEWKATWVQYRDKLLPNRKTGTELLNYLQKKYVLTEIYDKDAIDAIVDNITMNMCYSEKLPDGVGLVPRAFFLENTGNGKVLYQDENKDSADMWGCDITRIFVGIDIVTGFYTVEGSTMLWDELNAFRGLDEKDLQNWVCVSAYINALKRFNQMNNVLPE